MLHVFSALLLLVQVIYSCVVWCLESLVLPYPAYQKYGKIKKKIFAFMDKFPTSFFKKCGKKKITLHPQNCGKFQTFFFLNFYVFPNAACDSETHHRWSFSTNATGYISLLPKNYS